MQNTMEPPEKAKKQPFISKLSKQYIIQTEHWFDDAFNQVQKSTGNQYANQQVA